MRSTEISQKSNVWHFQFSIWFKSSLGEVQNPTWIGLVVPKLKQLKDSQNKESKRNASLFLAVSYNQFSRLPADPARSEHKCPAQMSCTLFKVLSQEGIIYMYFVFLLCRYKLETPVPLVGFLDLEYFRSGMQPDGITELVDSVVVAVIPEIMTAGWYSDLVLLVT